MVHAARAALPEAAPLPLSLVSCASVSSRDPVVAKATVLVVQSNALTLRSLGRLLEHSVGRVLLADGPAAAEALLEREVGRQVIIVCGQRFGADEATGAELLALWKARYPAVRFTVLATGAEGAPTAGGAIDAVFQKPSQPAELIEMLVAAKNGLRAALPPNHLTTVQESP